MTSHDIASIVQRRISARPFEPMISFKVSERGIQEHDGCWYVPILPSAEPKKMLPYFEHLAEIETDLLLEDDLNVFLLPGGPEAAPRAKKNGSENRPTPKRRKKLS